MTSLAANTTEQKENAVEMPFTPGSGYKPQTGRQIIIKTVYTPSVMSRDVHD